MAWLYVPVSADLNSGSDSPSETPTELYVTSSGTLTLRPLSWRGWQTRPWVKLLSGMIYSPSTLDRGAERWISSLPDSPASPSQSPASSEPKKTNATSSRESRRSFATWDRDSSSWKTCEGCLPLAGEESLATYSEPWPTSGSTRSGSACEQAPWVPPTDASGFSSWPTPTIAATSGYSERENCASSEANIGDTLTDMIWQGYPHSPPDPKTETPGRESSQSDPTLLRHWPTPGANDYKGSYQPGQRRGQLDEATEQKWAGGKAKLNPNFVEWMMGWPVGWTTARTGFDARAMESWRCKQRQLLAYLLGGGG